MIERGRGYLKWLAENANDPPSSVHHHVEILRDLAWLPAYAKDPSRGAPSRWPGILPLKSPLASLASTPETAQLHRLAARLARIKFDWFERHVLARLSPVAWPVVVALLLRKVDPATLRTAAEQSGRGRFVQAVRTWWDCVRLRIPPEEFHHYGLYRPERRRVVGDFILHHESLAIYRILNRRTVGLDRTAMADKAAFRLFCERHGIPTAKLLAIASEGQLTLFEPRTSPQWQGDVFMKPMHSSTGIGHYRWLHDETGRFRGPLDESLSQVELLEELTELSTLRAVLLQRRLVNDAVSATWTNGALATIRVMTGRSASGSIELIAAAIKLPVGSSIVDNFGRGNVLAQIDLATGVIAPGQLHRHRLVDIEHHPDTKVRFAGERVPQWTDIVRLAIRVHGLFKTPVLLSLDMAPTPDGPVVVEVNGRGDTRMLQYPGGQPLGQTLLPQIILGHFAGTEPSADTLSS